MQRLLLMCSLIAMLAACQRDVAAPPASVPTPTPAGDAGLAAAPARTALKDVIEHDPRYIVGISYPQGLDRYPGLAVELQRYADAARNELLEAVNGLGSEQPRAPYDLSLTFTTVVDTPQVVAVAADGSSYTGGAHGNPLLARFVWLPQHDKLLKTSALIATADGWRALSDYVREQLHAALSQRVDADEMAPADRAEILKSGLRMIDEGSGPEAGNFAQFEPVLGADGKLVALRFVFPPYQVGPYSDGVHMVEVPASMLLPHLQPAYRGLFAGG